MGRGTRALSVLIAAVVAVAIAGCAGGGMGGQVVPVEPGDLPKLAGTWQGSV